ncbi:MAG: hypothetical protein ACRCXD_18430 [Luteolibacter sp.]
MKTLTIGDTVYNLAYLISVKYKAKTRKDLASAKSKKPTDPEALKSASTLELHFLDCDTLRFRKEKADAVWSKLAQILEIAPDESPAEQEISNPS